MSKKDNIEELKYYLSMEYDIDEVESYKEFIASQKIKFNELKKIIKFFDKYKIVKNDLKSTINVCEAMTELPSEEYEEESFNAHIFIDDIKHIFYIYSLSYIFDTFKEYEEEVLKPEWKKVEEEIKEEKKINSKKEGEKKVILKKHKSRMKEDNKYAELYNKKIKELYDKEYNKFVNEVMKKNNKFKVVGFKDSELDKETGFCIKKGYDYRGIKLGTEEGQLTFNQIMKMNKERKDKLTPEEKAKNEEALKKYELEQKIKLNNAKEKVKVLVDEMMYDNFIKPKNKE